MSRYIDADYFARQIEDVIKSQRYDELVTCEKKFPTVADVLATVVDELRGKSLNGFELCPTADVRPNVHGEWVGTVKYCSHLEEKTGDKYLPSGIGNMIYCNQCWQASDRKSDFCPNCGADMRKEVE